MIEKKFIINNKMGLHARPAALFVQTTHKFDCQVTILKDDEEVDGKSIMGLLTLAAEPGAELTITADGPEEEQLMHALADLFARQFDEG